MIKMSILDMSLKILNLRLYPHPPGANELNDSMRQVNTADQEMKNTVINKKIWWQYLNENI